MKVLFSFVAIPFLLVSSSFHPHRKPLPPRALRSNSILHSSYRTNRCSLPRSVKSTSLRLVEPFFLENDNNKQLLDTIISNMASSMSTFASTSSSSSTFLDGTEPYFPILLSCLAGASTCVGAAIVFWLDPIQIRKSMSFALSLAGSVMITVSVVSIGPECWEDITTWGMFGKRLVSFLVGCMSYYALSKYLFPEPPEALFLIQQVSQDNPENANAPMDAKRKTWNPPFPDDKNDDGDDGQMKKEHDRPQDKLNAIIRTHDMEPSKTMSLNCDHSKPRSNNNKMKLDQTMTPRFRRTNTHPNPTTKLPILLVDFGTPWLDFLHP